MTLVAGIDSSTQSCKVVVCDAATGEVVRSGTAPHPPGTQVAPAAWWDALEQACARAGGLDEVDAVAVAGQQHGLVPLDAAGTVVRDALLWNDTRSAAAADDLVLELGEGDVDLGRRRWVAATGSVPVASFTVSKLRWLADAEPESLARTRAVALPHDYLTWRLCGAPGVDALTTDRSDASGTGYLDPSTGSYRPELIDLAARGGLAEAVLPRVATPHEVVGRIGRRGALVAPGCGDNAGAALGLGLADGGVSVSIGTSGVVCARSAQPTHDPSGLVAGFADAEGGHLPLVCTLNGSRVLDAACRLLGVAHDGLSRLALSVPDGADGLVLVPYLEGERTPNLPTATGSLRGMSLHTMTPAHVARAAVEGVLCLLAEGIAAIEAAGVDCHEVTLVGGGARSAAVRALAPRVLGVDVRLPEPGEYVARGAARQAAWALAGTDHPPAWGSSLRVDTVAADSHPEVLEQYRRWREWSA